MISICCLNGAKINKEKLYVGHFICVIFVVSLTFYLFYCYYYYFYYFVDIYSYSVFWYFDYYSIIKFINYSVKSNLILFFLFNSHDHTQREKKKSRFNEHGKKWLHEQNVNDAHEILTSIFLFFKWIYHITLFIYDLLTLFSYSNVHNLLNFFILRSIPHKIIPFNYLK